MYKPPHIAGIERYPDLKKRYQFDYVRSSSAGCSSNCQKGEVIRKYTELVSIRNASIARPKPRAL